MPVDPTSPEPDFSYDPFSPEALADPLPFYKVLRDHFRAYPLPQYDAWALSRFEDVWEVGQDHDLYTVVDGPVYEPAVLATSYGGPPPQPVTDPMSSFSTIDPPIHSALRQALGGPLRPGVVGRMAELMRTLARDQLERLSGKDEFNLTVDYAGQVSAGVMCSLVGLPLSVAPRLLTLVNRGMKRVPPGMSSEGLESQMEMHALLRDLVGQRRASGEKDHSRIIDRMLDTPIDGRLLTDDEITIQLTTIITGGTETVPKVVARGIYELWRRPRQRAAVMADIQAHCIPAFEEMMRYGAPLQYVGRALRRDAVVAGNQMRAGQRVLLLIPSANRDEREFEDPDEFIWNRKMERHFAFGHGVHFCIGVHVARLEGQVLLEEFLARFPDYDIDESRLEMPPSDFQVGYTRVLVTAS